MEHKVTLVVGKNGSIEVIDDDDEEKEPWGELSTLGFLLVSSTVLNLSVTCVGLLGRSRGTIEITPLALALSTTNTLDSMVNHTLGLIFLALWPDSSPPNVVCRLSAATYVAALIMQPLYILSHFLHLLFLRKPSSLLVNLPRLFIFLPPLVTAILSIPILVLPNLIQVRHFISRHVCGIAGENMAFSVALIILGIFSSWATIVYCLAARRCSCEASHQCCGEDKDVRYVVTLAGLASILVLPAVASFVVMSVTNLDRLSTYKDNDNDIVIITGTYDTVCTWLRFSFNTFSPLVMLIFYKDLRQECCQMLRFITTISISRCYTHNHVRHSKNTRSQGGPILFLTSNGLVLLRTSTDGRMPLDTCDLVDLEQKVIETQFTSVSPLHLPTLSPVTPKIRKKPAKNSKRKIVRFAQSVKEIPHSQDDSA